MLNKNYENVRSLVSESNYQTYKLSADMIKLDVIQGAIAELMERIDEITYKRWHEEPGMARLSIHEISNTVRLIDMAFHPLFTSLNDSVKNLEVQSDEMFDIFVKQADAADLVEEVKTNPLAGLIPLTAERSRELGIQQARKAFFEKFGTTPISDEEAIRWHQKDITESIERIKTEKAQTSL